MKCNWVDNGDGTETCTACGDTDVIGDWNEGEPNETDSSTA